MITPYSEQAECVRAEVKALEALLKSGDLKEHRRREGVTIRTELTMMRDVLKTVEGMQRLAPVLKAIMEAAAKNSEDCIHCQSIANVIDEVT